MTNDLFVQNYLHTQGRQRHYEESNLQSTTLCEHKHRIPNYVLAS